MFRDTPISRAPIRARPVGQLSSGMEGCNTVVSLFQDSVEDSQFVLILSRADFLAIFQDSVEDSQFVAILGRADFLAIF